MTIHTILITDASGSMGGLAEDVRGGHNAYLDQLIASGEDVRITLATFNTTVTMIDNSVPLAAATRLNQFNYRPGGMTALLDAVGQTLRNFQAQTVLNPGDKVFAFIQTDGHENSSREFNKAAVAQLVAEMEAQDWAFVFSGTGPGDWSEQGRSMGFTATATANAATSEGILRSYRGRGDAVVAYAAAAAATTDWVEFDSAAASNLIQAAIDKAGEGE